MRSALLAALAVAAAGCNLTYDREGVKFTPPVTPESCTGTTPDFCQLATRAFCTDLTADAENCGACGTPCQPGTACAGTAAAPVCATPCGSLPGYLVCGAGTEHPVCANTSTDPNNCGTCGQVCASGVCNSGVCALACGGATPDVCGTGAGAYCANLQTDLNNCGACSKLCTATCTAGVCDAGLVFLDVVPAMPINGKSWNDYVQQDATGAAIDNACDPAGSAWCAFGAELKTVTVPGRADCTGLTMTDALGAFQWDCTVGPTVRFTSSRKKSSPMKGLLDLVDVANGAWKRNAVTLFLNGAPYGVSLRTSWWTNPIVKGIPAGGVLGSAGAIYVADGLYSGPFPIQLTASKVSLVVPAGTLPAPAAGVASLVTADTNVPPAAPRDYLWIEGTFDAGFASIGIGLHGVRRSALWNARVARTATIPGSAAVLLDNASSYNYLQGVSTLGSDYGIQLNGATTTFNVVDAARVEGAATYGIELASTSTNAFLGAIVEGRGLGVACVHLGDAQQNGFRTLDASSCGAGVYVEGLGSTNNFFRDVRVAASRNEGVLVIDGSSNRFLGLVSVENQGAGVTVQASNGNVFSDVVVAANGGRGLALGSAKDNVVTSLTAARNAGGGVELNYASNNVLTSLALDGSGTSRALVLQGSSGNTFAYVAATSGVNALYEDATSIENGFFGELRVDTADTCQTTSTKPSFMSGAASTTAGCSQNGTRSSFGKTTIAKLFDPASPPFLGTSSDTVNGTWAGNPTRITSLDDPAVDWTGFAYPHRGWVRLGGAVGPLGCSVAVSPRDQASCTGVWAGDAEIYDWALKMGDPRLTGVPTPADPLANHLVLHNWSTGATVDFDPSAQELLDDGLGNEDGLCDAPLITPPEECLYTPNFGAYQGEGALSTPKEGTSPYEFYRAYEILGR